MPDPVSDDPPEGWKKVRGRKGHFRQAFERGQIIWAPRLDYWWLEVPRGAEKGLPGDWWGPWSFAKEDNARVAIAEWHDRLEKVGWFKLTPKSEGGYDSEELDRLLSKLPRSSGIPGYFLLCYDHRVAAEGKARRGDTLHIGGADLFFDARRSAGFLDGPSNRARLVAKKAGDPTDLARNVYFELDAASLDALIEFLLDIRASVVSEEAFQAHYRHVDRTGGEHPADGGPIPPDRILPRLQRMATASKAVSDIVTGIIEGAEKRPADLQLFAAMLMILGRGDRISGIKVEPDNDQPYVVDVMAGPDTATGQHMRLCAMQAEGKPH